MQKRGVAQKTRGLPAPTSSGSTTSQGDRAGEELKAKQAEKTKQYLGLKSELTENDVRFNATKYYEHRKRKEKLEEDAERLRKQREELSAKVSLISSENEKDEKQKNDIQLQLFELDKELHTYKIRIEDIDQKSEKNRARIEDQLARRTAIEKNIAERLSNIERLSEEKEKSERSGVEIRNKIADDREKLAAFTETRVRKIESIKNAGKTIEENKAAIKAAEARLDTLRDELEKVIKRLVDAIDRRKAEIMGSEQERQEVRRTIHERLDSLVARVNEAVRLLAAGDAGRASELLRGLDVESLRELVNRFESYEDGFRSILFDKGGIHSEKEAIDSRIREEVAGIESLKTQNANLDEFIVNERRELEDVSAMITRIERTFPKTRPSATGSSGTWIRSKNR
jgi:chromosome segregation ATPase